MRDRPSRTRVGILIFDDVEVLDFCGPFEVFSVANALGEVDDAFYLYSVHVIAETLDVVSCRNRLLVQPHATIDDHPPLDIVVVPGGRGTRRQRTNDRVLSWLRDQAATADTMTSVCTGAFLLAAIGLLDGKAATTHWGSIDRMREHHPDVEIREIVRFADQGPIVTSAGVSAGIDMALHIVDRMHGRAVALQTARHMEYEWRPDA
jgi:transcriptional regulator GlxA family with amidase domain